MKAFVAAFDTLFGGFRQRALRTFELLQDRRTAFLVVAAPEPDALREAAYFVERLRAEQMPLAGLVVNRASSKPDGDLTAPRGDDRRRAAARPSGEDHGLAAGLLRLHADRLTVVRAREAADRSVRARAIPTYPRPCCRPCRPTCTTSTACAASASCWRPRWTARPASWLTGLRRSSTTRPAALVLDLGGLEQRAPRGHVRPLAQQCTALTLGEAAPHAPLDLGCPAPRPGTRLAPGKHRTRPWPCAARHPGRTARPAMTSGTGPQLAHISFQDMSPPSFRSRVLRLVPIRPFSTHLKIRRQVETRNRPGWGNLV